MKEFIEKLIGRLEKLLFFTTMSGDYIRKKDVIEIVNQLAEEYIPCNKSCTECEAYDKEKHHCPKFCKVIKETVRELEENHNGWIPCSERLPEDGETVLVQDFEEHYEILNCETKYGVKGFSNGWWASANNYIAWQPLPQFYQPKGE